MIYCDIVADILQSYGLTTHIAHNAGEAQALLESVRPDLVLLDIMMPEVDGLTIVRRMRSNPTWSEIPVIITSAKVQSEDRSAAMDAGANSFLAKPFSARDLRAALRPFVSVPDTGSLGYSVVL